MNISSSFHSSRALPLGFLGFLCLIFCVEVYLTIREPDLIKGHLIDWRLTGRSVATEAPGCGVLCFGDSLVKYGIAPRVIEERTDKRAYNFAMATGAAPANYFLLRRALESGAQPTAVIMDGELLFNDPLAIPSLWSELVSVSELFQLACAGGPISACNKILLCQLLPSLRQYFEIREWVLHSAQGKYKSRRPFVSIYLRSSIINQGAHFFPNTVHEGLDASLATYNPWGWACHPLNLVFVRRFLELARDRKITVFWLLPPVHPATQALRDRNRFEDPYIRLLNELEQKFPNLVIIDARHSEYDETAYFDYTHLNHRGAFALSNAVAGELNRYLQATGKSSSWLTLASYRPVAGDQLLEDLDQARTALRTDWSRLQDRGGRRDARKENAAHPLTDRQTSRAMRVPSALAGTLGLSQGINLQATKEGQ